MNKVSVLDRVCFYLQHRIKKALRRMTDFYGGFLISALINIMTDGSIRNFKAIFARFLDFHPLSLAFWVLSSVLLVLALLQVFIARRVRFKTPQMLLASTLIKRADESILPHLGGTFAWGTSLSLAAHPDLQKGWKLGDVQIHRKRTRLMSRDRMAAYESYMKEPQNESRFIDDQQKYALLHNPEVSSDAPTLLLELGYTTYSQVTYCRERIAGNPGTRKECIDQIVRNKRIRLPSALCLHAVIITADDKYLFAQRSHKVSYWPRAWSLSIEEQLSEQDFVEGNQGALARCVRRMLREELALNHDQYTESNVRLLSVLLEGEILNFALCCIVPVDLSAAELEKIIRARPRSDYEFSDFLFLSRSELLREVLHPGRLMHPTAGLRSILALIHQGSLPDLEKEASRIIPA